MEAASRRRKEALVESLADVLLEYSGVPLARDRALVIAGLCIQQFHTSITYHLMALGYAYDDAARRWRLQPRLR